MAVVNSNLEVYDMQFFRLVDASTIPKVVSKMQYPNYYEM
jgi:hypothetical protein